MLYECKHSQKAILNGSYISDKINASASRADFVRSETLVYSLQEWQSFIPQATTSPVMP